MNKKVSEQFKDIKDIYLLQCICTEQDEEIERLNNIINELEKHLEKIIIDGGTTGSMTFWYRQIYDYLQELKGSE